MKKLTIVILLLVCLVGMAACRQVTIEDDGNIGISTQPPTQPQATIHACEMLAQYLDDVHFVPQRSQGELMDQMEQYTYNGKTVLALSEGVFYDGPYGGGFDGNGELCGFHNSYWMTEDYGHATYSNSMYTSVPLEGLELPLEITFGDTLQTVLEKLQVRAPQNTGGTQILCSDEDRKLELTENKTPSEEDPYACRLKYTQTYRTTHDDGTVADVTRTVIMSFQDTGSRLGLFEMSVEEYYPVAQTE